MRERLIRGPGSTNQTLVSQHGTPYQAGTYNMDVDFTEDYPFKPPVVRSLSRVHFETDGFELILSRMCHQLKFTTKMYHPNIDSDGK